ncbi:hypothetical protein AB0C10_06425 [Microbispora amethystogenes]|uniref:AMP-binding enzyme n=1 Tax=Microbispora amethystogenes TaxID=1427754 RepID=UPI0033C9B89D
MVIHGGKNVCCAEVEAALFEHSTVDDAVIGIPDELSEQVGAVVRLKHGAEATGEQLQEFLRDRIAAFKVPVRFWSREAELPRDPGARSSRPTCARRRARRKHYPARNRLSSRVHDTVHVSSPRQPEGARR